MESHPSAAAAGGGISEIRRLRKERDELKEAVRSFEAELTQIQLDTKMLAEDRDNFKLLYEQVEIIFLIFDTVFETASCLCYSG